MVTRPLVFQKQVSGEVKFSDEGCCRERLGDGVECPALRRCASISSIGLPQTLHGWRAGSRMKNALYMLGLSQSRVWTSSGRLRSRGDTLIPCDCADARQVACSSQRTHGDEMSRVLVDGATARGGGGVGGVLSEAL